MLLASLSDHMRQLSSPLKRKKMSIAEVPPRWKGMGLRVKYGPIQPHHSHFKHNGKERKVEERKEKNWESVDFTLKILILSLERRATFQWNNQIRMEHNKLPKTGP